MAEQSHIPMLQHLNQENERLQEENKTLATNKDKSRIG